MASSPFRYQMLPTDLFRRSWHIRLRRRYPDLTDRIYHVTILAQDARAKGRILIGGQPAAAEDIALAWDQRSTEEDIQTWEDCLGALAGEGILVVDKDGAYRVARPADWYRPPSKLENRDCAAEKNKAAPKPRGNPQFQKTREAAGSLGKPREAAGTKPEPEPEPELEPEPTYHPYPSSTVPTSSPGPAAAAAVSDSVRGAALPVYQACGLIGSLQGGDWRALSDWAVPAVQSGQAVLADLVTALQFGADAMADARARGESIRSRWRYVCRIAAEHLEAVVARRRMTESALARGRPAPRPYRFDSGPDIGDGTGIGDPRPPPRPRFATSEAP